MMANRVHKASHSSILSEQKSQGLTLALALVQTCLCFKSGYLCDVRTTARPSWITLMMEFQRKRLERGSIPVVGSSYKYKNKLLLDLKNR